MLGSDLYNKATDQEKTEEKIDPPNGKANPPGILKKSAENDDTHSQKTTKGKNNEKKRGDFPIPLAVTILIIWILLSSALFCLWETDW